MPGGRRGSPRSPRGSARGSRSGSRGPERLWIRGANERRIARTARAARSPAATGPLDALLHRPSSRRSTAIFNLAAWAIFAAMLLDGLDGRVARLTSTASEFGKEFDSLADMVLVRPGAGHRRTTSGASSGSRSTAAVRGRLGWLAAFLYAACALRSGSSRASTATPHRDRRLFQGLAEPGGGRRRRVDDLGFATVAVRFRGSRVRSSPASPSRLVTGLLMMSRFAYMSFKDFNPGAAECASWQLLLVSARHHRHRARAADGAARDLRRLRRHAPLLRLVRRRRTGQRPSRPPRRRRRQLTCERFSHEIAAMPPSSCCATRAGDCLDARADVGHAPVASARGSTRAVRPRPRSSATRCCAPTIPGSDSTAKVAGCTACSLHATRTQTVFGVGNRRAEWLVIGEAPGADEDRKGEPFVGRAGSCWTRCCGRSGCRARRCSSPTC